MPKPIVGYGERLETDLINTLIHELQFDGEDEVGHWPRLMDDALSNAAGQIKDRVAQLLSALKVEHAGGLDVTWYAGTLYDAGGLQTFISAGAGTVPNNATTMLYVSPGADVITIGPSFPANALKIATVISSAGAIQSITDHRGPSIFAPFLGSESIAQKFASLSAATTSIDTGSITSGTLDAARVPNLDASKITSGTLGVARIPDLDAGKITSGILNADRVPNLDASKITTGTLSANNLGTSGTRGATTFLRGDNTWSNSITQDILVNGLAVGRGGGGFSTNAVMGAGAGASNTIGTRLSAFGDRSAASNTTGINVSAFGKNSATLNTTGNLNSAFGANSLVSNTTGSSNSTFGADSGFSNTTGSGHCAFGASSLFSSTTGQYNSVFGTSAGYHITTGSGNIVVGSQTSGGSLSPAFQVTTENNRVVMGSTAVTNAYIQVAWTVVSDARDKTNFGAVPLGLEFVNALNPISYQYKMSRDSDEPNGAVRYGFKAQEILELEGENPVIIDADDPEKLRFNNDSLVAVLVNSIKELTAMVKDLQAEVNTLKGKA
jgi:hypothetical protein